MADSDKVNILLVDDQPAKLLAYEVILGELGDNLFKANSAREAFTVLLKQEIAVAGARPVLSDAAFAQKLHQFRTALELTEPSPAS